MEYEATAALVISIAAFVVSIITLVVVGWLQHARLQQLLDETFGNDESRTHGRRELDGDDQ